jgi:hypothetical protein
MSMGGGTCGQGVSALVFDEELLLLYILLLLHDFTRGKQRTLYDCLGFSGQPHRGFVNDHES